MRHSLITDVLLIVLLCSCSIQEQDVDLPDTMLEVNSNPVIASYVDSLKMNEAKSSIQCSPEYILASFTVYEDGEFSVEITEEELSMLGVSEKSYQEYLNGLSIMNNSHLINAE